MFGRIRVAKPESVHFQMIEGKPCFYQYIAFKYRKNEQGENEYNPKDLDKVARHKFDIEQAKKKYPNKYWWEVIEENDCFILRYFPTVADEVLYGRVGYSFPNLKSILQHFSEG